MDAGRLVQISQNVILSHEDKFYQGAFIASASIPWGQHKGDEDVGGYHLVWTRDMVQSATALLACGRVDTARERWFTLPARKSRMAASPRTFGSTELPTGGAFSLTKLLSLSSLPGGFGSWMAWAALTSSRLSSVPQVFWSAMLP